MKLEKINVVEFWKVLNFRCYDFRESSDPKEMLKLIDLILIKLCQGTGFSPRFVMLSSYLSKAFTYIVITKLAGLGISGLLFKDFVTCDNIKNRLAQI